MSHRGLAGQVHAGQPFDGHQAHFVVRHGDANTAKISLLGDTQVAVLGCGCLVGRVRRDSDFNSDIIGIDSNGIVHEQLNFSSNIGGGAARHHGLSVPFANGIGAP